MKIPGHTVSQTENETERNTVDPLRLIQRALTSDTDRREWLKRAIAAGAMVSVVPALLAASRLPTGQTIYKLSGDVRVNSIKATPKSNIKSGDTVETGRDSAITFVVGTDAFRMRENSRVELQPTPDRGVGLLRVLTGGLLSVYGKGRKRIRTPTATIGIRGTGTYVEASEERTYFCCCYGTAEMASSLNSALSETVETSYHEAPRFISGGDTPEIIPAPVINHGDDELVLLESLVGRVPPFYEGEERGGSGGYG